MQLAIYSPADRLQPHRFKADESYEVGTPQMAPVSCYLDTDSIIAIAKAQDVDAIHPGYDFSFPVFLPFHIIHRHFDMQRV